MRQRVSRAGDAGERAAHDATGTGTHVRRHPADMPADLDVESVVAPALADAGKPLDPAHRAGMERHLRFDFSHVRIHDDERADASARRLDAAAYTVGEHIVFAAGQYQPATVPGRALLAHELAHVAHLGREVVHRSGPLGFFGDIFTEGPGEALSRLFGEGTFSPEELTKYLAKLRDTQQVEGDYDSDNKARAITRLWVRGDRRFQLDAQLKRLLVREMWEGTTSGGDAQAIMDILERSLDPDLLAILTIGGVPPKELYDSFGGNERRRLVTLLDQRVRGGSKVALKGGPLELTGGPNQPTNLNDETFRRRWEAALVDAVDRMRKAMVTDPATCSFPSGLSMKFDEAHWRQSPMVLVDSPQGKITVRDTSGHGSFVPKSGTPFEAVSSLYDNMTKWQCDCLFATQVAQLFAWKEALTPEAFNNKFAGFRTGAGLGSPTTGLESDAVSVVGDTTQESLERSLLSAPVGTTVIWNNIKAPPNSSFEHEHVLKISHHGTGEDDQYAAHGYPGVTFGDPLSADQVRWHLAQINADFPWQYAIDAQTMNDLRVDNIAPSLIQQLQQHLGFNAKSWEEFLTLEPISDLAELTSREAQVQLAKIRRRAKRPPVDPQSPGDPKFPKRSQGAPGPAHSYVDNTIILERIDIPK